MADDSGHFVADQLKAERLTSNRFVSDEYGIVDVKSSQFHKKYFWHFLIRRDQLPDHFAFACFDEDITLTRCYLVPACVVQDRRTVTITRGQESKWLPYLTYAIDIQSLKSPKQSKVIGRSTPYIVRRKRNVLCVRDSIFWWMFRGTRTGRLFLRSQVSIRDGKLYYYNRKFSRASWAWHPPEVIRLLGRSAREYYNITNNRPIDWFNLGDSWVGVRRRCDECNGDLVYGPGKFLYCIECGLQAIWSPVYMLA
jgi:hypothetical protein